MIFFLAKRNKIAWIGFAELALTLKILKIIIYIIKAIQHGKTLLIII